MTRMMNIVPASRLVRDASPEPSSIDRSRAITPAGGAVVDGASVTVTAGNPEKSAAWCGDHSAYQLFVKIRLGGSRRQASSFRGVQSMNPESRDSPRRNCTSEVRADARPEMTLRVNSG